MENKDNMQNKAKKTLYDKKTCVYGLMQVYDASTTRIRREWGKKQKPSRPGGGEKFSNC